MTAGTSFQIRIRELVQNVRSDQRHRVIDVRRCQQMIDDLDQAIVEISVRVTEIHIAALKKRVEAPVHFSHLCEISARYQVDQGIVAAIVVVVEVEFAAAILSVDNKRAADTTDRSNAFRHLGPRQVVDGGNDALD